MNKRQIGEYVHQLAESHDAEFKCGYKEAFHRVLAADPALKAAYVGDLPAQVRPVTLNLAEEQRRRIDARKATLASQQAGAKLAERTAYYLKIHNGCTYSEAFREVLASHPELKRAYAGVQS